MDIESISNEVLRELAVSPSDAGIVRRDIAVKDVPRMLEHSLLVSSLTLEGVAEACHMARRGGIAALYVPPQCVAEAVDILSGSLVAVGTAIGFPSGFLSTEAKVADVRAATNHGATELDIAIDMNAVKSGSWQKARHDFCAAAETAVGRATVKLVFEHGGYTEEEKKEVLLIAKSSGVEYVKIQNLTSGHAARVQEISLVRRVLGDNVKIKIDGGVKTLQAALTLLTAGADRIGLTATKAVIDEVGTYRQESIGR